MSNSLYEHRVRSAKASGGISSHVIKQLILKIIRQRNLGGWVLDVGAGTGELLRLLQSVDEVVHLDGVDIIERPTDLSPSIGWHTQDLNADLLMPHVYDIIICSEVIEHLENPRSLLRSLRQVLAIDGHLILTMPNQESIRSYAGVILGGHFTHFLGKCHPAHITALLRMDLVRICAATGFATPRFFYTDYGCIPKLTSLTWQRLSCGLLKGRLFSDNIAMMTRSQQDSSTGSDT